MSMQREVCFLCGLPDANSNVAGRWQHTSCLPHVTALRAEVEVLKGLDSYAANKIEELRSQLSARDAEVRALREKVDELLTACDDSDGAQYGTIATKFVRAVLQGESRQRGDGGKYGAALHQNLTDRAWQALRDFLNGTPEQWAKHALNQYLRGVTMGCTEGVKGG
jgi:hypothetical protein